MRGKSKAIVPEIQPASDGQAREAAEVGVWLGRRQAFAMMAGRCSASDAECLRDIRAHKRYRAFNMAWDQFCTEHLGINRATADRVIRQLDEFGPEFFTLTQDPDYQGISDSATAACQRVDMRYTSRFLEQAAEARKLTPVSGI